jgi:hypothetical protein
MTDLDQQQRRQKVAELRAEGLSFRKIGQQLGISHEHARRMAQVTPLTSVRSRGQVFADLVHDRYELDEPEEQILTQLSRLMDHADALQAAVEADGAVIVTVRGDRRPNPAIAEVRQVSATIGRLLAQLALPDSAGDLLASPTQQRARRAANTRWNAYHRRPGHGGA